MKAYEVARSTNNPKKLSALAKHKDMRVRKEVVRNPYTTDETRAELSQDENWLIRLEVAKSPYTAEEVLAERARDPISYVREYVILNQKTSDDILAWLAEEDVSEYIRERAREELARRRKQEEV